MNKSKFFEYPNIKNLIIEDTQNELNIKHNKWLEQIKEKNES